MTTSNTMTYGQIANALDKAKIAESDAEAWMNLAKLSAGTELFEARQKEYQQAAQRAITARLEWLAIRNDFESGK